LPETFLASKFGTQAWLDWHISAGGVATNIARHLDEAGVRSVFFALPGIGTLADFAVLLAKRDLHKSELIVISGEEGVGLVCLLHVEGKEPRRLVIGPQRAQVDLVRYADIRNLMKPVVSQVRGVFLDGYLLRLRPQDWIADIESMAADGWKVHLELVPHDIWKNLGEQDLLRLRAACASISSALSTIERIVRIVPNSRLDSLQRSKQVARRLENGNGILAPLHLRWGIRSDAEMCLMLTREGKGILWHYRPESRMVKISSQDRLYVREITDRIPGNWRSEVGRFMINDR
jgi:hypothetical protein